MAGTPAATSWLPGITSNGRPTRSRNASAAANSALRARWVRSPLTTTRSQPEACRLVSSASTTTPSWRPKCRSEIWAIVRIAAANRLPPRVRRPAAPRAVTDSAGACAWSSPRRRWPRAPGWRAWRSRARRCPGSRNPWRHRSHPRPPARRTRQAGAAALLGDEQPELARVQPAAAPEGHELDAVGIVADEQAGRSMRGAPACGLDAQAGGGETATACARTRASSPAIWRSRRGSAAGPGRPPCRDRCRPRNC